jgi:hypothetical protein
MVDKDSEPNQIQQTKPKKGEPITIPVPKKDDVMDFLEKTAKTPVQKPQEGAEPRH